MRETNGLYANMISGLIYFYLNSFIYITDKHENGNDLLELKDPTGFIRVRSRGPIIKVDSNIIHIMISNYFKYFPSLLISLVEH